MGKKKQKVLYDADGARRVMRKQIIWLIWEVS